METGEHARILQRFEDLSMKAREQVYRTLLAIGKPEVDPIFALMPCGHYMQHDRSLIQRRNRNQGPVLPRAAPILEKFFPMNRKPFTEVRDLTAGEGPFEYRILDEDSDFEFTISGMKMRRIVVLIEHGDDDSKEARDFRHRVPLIGYAILRPAHFMNCCPDQAISDYA
jgi:hypothetical protein